MLLISLFNQNNRVNRRNRFASSLDFVRDSLLDYLLMLSLSLFSHTGFASNEQAQPSTTHHSAESIQTLIEQAEQLRQRGYYHQALLQYQNAETQAQQSNHPQHAVLAGGLLGYLLFLMRDYSASEPLLLNALQQAVSANWSLQAAIHANHLGNVYAAQNKADKAMQFYQEARELGQKNSDQALVARIDVNQLRLVRNQNPEQAWRLLLQLQKDLRPIKSLQERAQLQLAISYQAIQLQAPASVSRQHYQSFTQVALNEARQSAIALSLPRLIASAYGYQGEFEAQQANFTTALKQTQFAIAALQGIDAKDQLLKLEWQRGRILRKLGNDAEALMAYRLSVRHIQAIRGDIPVDYQNGRSSFRETLQPVYTGLTDLLIQQADKTNNAAQKQALLREAKNTIERIKQTELEDYFENRCTLQTVAERALENIASNTAVIYPIILKDRLELLISIGNTIEHHSVSVSSSQLIQTAQVFAHKLRYFKPDYLQESVQLYQWLIAPLAPLLEKQRINTLVFIPDGALRLVPLVALSDGSDFLMQHYAVVTSPGLKLFDPQPLPRNKLDTLLAGLSMPGTVIEDLPDSTLAMLLDVAPDTQSSERSLLKSRDLNQLLLNSKQQNLSSTARSFKEMIKDPAMFNQAKQLLALPGVSDEIKALSNLLPTTVLLNETYSKKRLGKEINETPYRIIHIASHGIFGGTASESYIMAHDKIVTVAELENLLQSNADSDSPIELLTLSACQTAEGDDRSPLGISGVAIKAKVRSALGSLWPVSDVATVDLMTIFYQQLKSANTSKVQALQKAQQHLFKNPDYQHPFFWSPFILIGNWL